MAHRPTTATSLQPTPVRAMAAPSMPTIATQLPTIVAPAQGAADHPADHRATDFAARVAADFVRWAAAHDLARAWTVDDVWYLATQDFGPALGVDLPPRRVFLGQLQRVVGVAVAYDRRQYTRDGRVKCKTTVYTLPAAIEAQPELALAA